MATQRERFFAAYAPELVEDYVEKHLERLYNGQAPTLKEAAARYGEDTVKDWLKVMIEDMAKFSGAEGKADPEVLDRAARMAKASFGWLKTTEFMHFAHLFAMGKYGKFYGAPDGQTVMAALSAYASGERESMLRLYCKPSPAQEAPARAVLCPETSDMISRMLTAENVERWGGWRKEPWGEALCKAYFVSKAAPTFPGDMPYAARRSWALANGFDKETVGAWEAQHAASLE